MTTKQDFLIIGHRGAGGEKFENSMSGFKHALRLGLDGVELDIRAHKGELWVIHDHELERLTGNPGKFDELPDPTLIRLKNNEPVPRLSEVLDLLWGKIPINIEIKSFNTATLLADMLAQYPLPETTSRIPWVLISSFDHRQLLELRQLNSPWALAPVTYGVPMLPDAIIEKLKPYSWHMDDEYLDFDLIKKLQDRGIKVLVYTINDIQAAQQLMDAGVDGIFTDLPSTLRQID